jgi:adenine-specific DNA-methyltransferase
MEIYGVNISNEDRYNSEDQYVNERGKYYLQKLGMGSIQYSQSLDYEILTPDGTTVMPADNNSGKKACWRWSKKKFEWGIENDFIVFEKRNSNWIVYTKQYLKCDNEGNIIERTQKQLGIIDEYSTTSASKDLQELMNDKIFDFPKPVSLIKRILQISTSPNDLILDFFAGSGTTGQAVMELNQEEIDKQSKDGLLADKTAEAGGRKFILVQLPEKIDEKKEAFKAGYKHISDITIERVRRAGEKYKNVDNGFKVLSVTESAINRKLMGANIATKEEIFAEIALQFGYGLNFVVKNLFDKVFKLTGNDRQAIVILGNKELTNEMQKQIIGKSDELKECQIFAQDACLNVEIIHNLYQHFEQKRVVIL